MPPTSHCIGHIRIGHLYDNTQNRVQRWDEGATASESGKKTGNGSNGVIRMRQRLKEVKCLESGPTMRNIVRYSLLALVVVGAIVGVALVLVVNLVGNAGTGRVLFFAMHLDNGTPMRLFNTARSNKSCSLQMNVDNTRDSIFAMKNMDQLYSLILFNNDAKATSFMDWEKSILQLKTIETNMQGSAFKQVSVIKEYIKQKGKDDLLIYNIPCNFDYREDDEDVRHFVDEMRQARVENGVLIISNTHPASVVRDVFKVRSENIVGEDDAKNIVERIVRFSRMEKVSTSRGPTKASTSPATSSTTGSEEPATTPEPTSVPTSESTSESTTDSTSAVETTTSSELTTSASTEDPDVESTTSSEEATTSSTEFTTEEGSTSPLGHSTTPSDLTSVSTSTRESTTSANVTATSTEDVSYTSTPTSTAESSSTEFTLTTEPNSDPTTSATVETTSAGVDTDSTTTVTTPTASTTNSDESSSTSPTEPSTSTSPTEPSTSTSPTESSTSTSPTEPSTSTSPTKPSTSTSPTEPSTSTSPSEPSKSTSPTEPSTSTSPTEPSTSTSPTKPSKFTSPTGPSTSTSPTEPSKSTSPTEPSPSTSEDTTSNTVASTSTDVTTATSTIKPDPEKSDVHCVFAADLLNFGNEITNYEKEKKLVTAVAEEMFSKVSDSTAGLWVYGYTRVSQDWKYVFNNMTDNFDDFQKDVEEKIKYEKVAQPLSNEKVIEMINGANDEREEKRSNCLVFFLGKKNSSKLSMINPKENFKRIVVVSLQGADFSEIIDKSRSKALIVSLDFTKEDVTNVVTSILEAF
ncbi:hypothetical protein Y032_0073g733 [Ancylostoma ceylanicum]|uniref:Uncharacterized protein n=2 Tax=Ancylostoma ceylanicum TaxID=53326 RepID=A0A016TW24_9BILA|nr:hypothetical protein Y032_0073g733 [Ancylostoma ceylanicum]